MNPLLQKLQPYPFERLRKLFEGVTPNPAHQPISLGIGEPKHPTPDFIKQTLAAALHDPASDFTAYPPTAGTPALRAAFTGWLQRRYGLTLDPSTQVLPVNGTREALFAFAQTVIDPTADAGRSPPGRPKASSALLEELGGSEPHAVGSVGAPYVVCPNPFYQIYEGAALLAGATPYYAPSDPKRNFAVDWDSVPDDVWQRTQLLYVCSPGNPTGAVMPLDEWRKLFALSDRYGFIIASDECYSEIYFRDEPPLGGLEAATRLGRSFERLVAFTSLSKRSNVPGLRSGFAMGDAALLKAFLLYRTYHGSAMAPPTQAASIAAWGDEAHVVANREQYRAKFARVTPILAEVLDVALPDAGFYLWAGVRRVCGGDDAAFARELLAQYNVTVLPGSYLAREANKLNPGQGRIRMALVAETAECEEAARRIVQFVQSHK
ncbi:succinyldiaminopimelate transaminase [Hylemonella gracilis]|jgi:N-succinyldiaminopimelate aminotransferase|uniref:Succinyldiaminopimelate transaminase n=1 Tax=Hylemonella gracilis TaxID=80880 RepID=A0A4P6UNL8_9BURK|nr:succinyldiaminopimelate transaminase [Hylemonella gracilis]QBK05687.1 succinyldiaminopimelate transaminase [Hylemonella gracilis]